MIMVSRDSVPNIQATITDLQYLILDIAFRFDTLPVSQAAKVIGKENVVKLIKTAKRLQKIIESELK